MMSNHFHLVVETPRANLSGRACGGSWDLHEPLLYNRRHRLCGHLFSGRFKALNVKGSGMHNDICVSGAFHRCVFVHP
jgi:putative transposase